MERVENEAVQAYLIESVTQDLKNCKLFTKTFGKNFVRVRLSRNLDKLYTNINIEGKLGYYDTNANSITLCASGKNGALLSVQDIEGNENLETTVLHEAIHAILKKSDKECKRSKIVSGTGILETYQSKRNHYLYIQLGRGLNEGLTNWICEKAGKKVTSYEILTNLARQLEIAIGPEKTMKICKGNIKKNVASLLNMTQRECSLFLAKADEIYTQREEIKELNHIAEILTFFTREDQITDDFEKFQKMQEKYRNLDNIEFYNNLEKNVDYNLFLFENKLENSLKSKLRFCKYLGTEKIAKVSELRVNLESVIFNKYLQKDFEELIRSDNVDEKQYERFNKFLSLIEKDEKQQGESIEFQRRFSDKKTAVLKQLAVKYQANNLSFNEFMETVDLTRQQDPNQLYQHELIEKMCNLIYPQNPQGARFLVTRLVQENRLHEINEYSLLDVQTENVKNTVYLRNGKIEFTSRCFNNGKSFEANENISNPNNLFDITYEFPDQMQQIVNNFVILKQRIEKSNPNAQIDILNDTIVVTNKGKPFTFLIDGTDILLASSNGSKETTINFAPEEKENNRNLPAVQNNSFFTKILNTIKRRLSNYEKTTVDNLALANQDIEDKKDSHQNFVSELSDMSNYSEISEKERNDYNNSDNIVKDMEENEK